MDVGGREDLIKLMLWGSFYQFLAYARTVKLLKFIVWKVSLEFPGPGHSAITMA